MTALRFAATKIQPPRPGAVWLARPGLDTRLRQALLSHRAVLVQAPAGFGKTSALAAQLAQRAAGAALAWVSLDEDDDAERLFACLVAALDAFDLPWRTAPEALVELAGGDAAGLKRAAVELINALAGAEVAQGLLVFDDLHRVRSPGAFHLLNALLERLPPAWTLVLASRTPPPLPALARLRAGGDLAEFTVDDLRFSRSETGALLRADSAERLKGADSADGIAGVAGANGTAGIAGADVANVANVADAAARAGDLFDRTAGWPAGLRLALAALRGPGAAAAPGRQRIDRHLFDYLAAEVLDDLPPPLHDFLLRCAVLPALTAARAAAVSGDRHAGEWLDEVERRGLFATALDAQERTLVLHDLFRDALLQRLQARMPDELPALLRRAAAGEADALRRVGYLVRAGDWAAAEAVLADTAADMLVQGGAREVLRLVEQFPLGDGASANLGQARVARLARLAGTACGLRWQWPAMARWLARAAQAAAAAGDDAERHLAQARLAYALYPVDRNAEAMALVAELNPQPLAPPARALLCMADAMQQFRQGHHARLPGLFGTVLAVLEAGAPLLQWWECAPPYNWSTIAGMPPLLRRYLAGAEPRLGDRPLPMRGDLRLLRAVLLLWTGEMPAAEQALADAEDDIRWLAVSGEAEIGTAVLRAVVDAVHGRAEAVHARLDALAAREDGDADPERRLLWRHQMAVYGVRLSDTLGDAAGLARWAARLKENPLQDAVSHQNPRAVAARARHAAAQGRWQEAVSLFAALAEKLPTMDVMGQRTDLTLRSGHALVQAQRLPEAALAVAPVLDRLCADGVRGQALLCGPAVLQALADARWGSLLTPPQQAELQAAAQLSATLQAPAAAQPAAAATGIATAAPSHQRSHADAAEPAGAARPPTAPAAVAAAAAPLSAREREVLERIAAGDSNKLIARLLEISPHTVKRHVANILDKLGLASRGQASAWLRDHA